MNTGPCAPVGIAVSELSRRGCADTNVGEAELADVSDVLEGADDPDELEVVDEFVEAGDVELDVVLEALDELELLDAADAETVDELGAEDGLLVPVALSVEVEADELAAESDALEDMLLWDAALAIIVCIVVGAADKGSAAAAPPLMLGNAVAAQRQAHTQWPAGFLVPVPWTTWPDEPTDAGTATISIECIVSL